jgi:hypothetical protein
MSDYIPAFPNHSQIAEPELLFHPFRLEDRRRHPLLGLLEFGPYSRSTINTVLDPIRVGIIAPHRGLQAVRHLLVEFGQQHSPRERKNYLPTFPGFSRVFGLNIVAGGIQHELPEDLDSRVASASAPHQVLADAVGRAFNTVQISRAEFDVLAIYLPNRWERGFWGPKGDSFDLHDFLKAIAAARGTPTQIINEDSALAYDCRCSVMWRLGIAIYCKAGGVPWKLAGGDADTAFVGLSYAIRDGSSGRPQFVTCCSQVFDSEGAGLEFVVYDTDEIHIERENPFLSRGQMRRVMARSLALYQRQHAGRSPARVVIHKSTEFKDDEVEGCFDAWRSSSGLELIQVQQDSGWRGVLLDPPKQGSGDRRGTPAAYPCERGSFLPLDGFNVLLWTQGNAPSASLDGRAYYKEGKGIPAPLLLKRFAGHGAWDQACHDVVGLSKMNWNNDNLYDRLPVTMAYAQILAQVIKRMPSVLPQPYQFRLFM